MDQPLDLKTGKRVWTSDRHNVPPKKRYMYYHTTNEQEPPEVGPEAKPEAEAEPEQEAAPDRGQAPDEEPEPDTESQPTPDEDMGYMSEPLDMTINGALDLSTGKDNRLLWEFINELLLTPGNTEYVRWEDQSQRIFRIVSPSGLAHLWGRHKNKANMNYEKMSRALRYYYNMNIIAKEPGRRLTYRFTTPPQNIKKGIRGAKPGVPHKRSNRGPPAKPAKKAKTRKKTRVAASASDQTSSASADNHEVANGKEQRVEDNCAGNSDVTSEVSTMTSSTSNIGGGIESDRDSDDDDDDNDDERRDDVRPFTRSRVNGATCFSEIASGLSPRPRRDPDLARTRVTDVELREDSFHGITSIKNYVNKSADRTLPLSPYTQRLNLPPPLPLFDFSHSIPGVTGDTPFEQERENSLEGVPGSNIAYTSTHGFNSVAARTSSVTACDVDMCDDVIDMSMKKVRHPEISSAGTMWCRTAREGNLPS